MYTLTDAAPAGRTLFDFPAPAGRVVSGAFDDAIETNPVPLFMLARELNAQRSIGPRLSQDEAKDYAAHAGVEVKVPEDGISQAALSILVERRKDQAARDTLFARKEGTASTIGVFGAGFVGSLMDPINAASGFIPILSGTRYAAALGNAATAGSRAALRAGIGGAEGAVGAVLTEMPTMAFRRDLQDDYGLYDSLANVAFGTFASGGLRVVGGVARDRWRGLQAARQEDFLRSVEPAEWSAARAMYERQIERDFMAELEGGFERGAGPSDGLSGRWAADRTAAERLAATDETIGRMQSRMSDAEIERFVEAEKQMRAASSAPGADDRMLLDQGGIADRKFREMDLAEVRDRLRRGEGLIVVPGNATEIAEAISDETHAIAMKTAVAQAVEGRRIDVDPVVRQDAVFGPQRMSASEAKSRARSNMAPENKVGSDRAASQRAAESIQKAEAPAAKSGGTEPPPPRGSRAAEAAGVTAQLKDLAEAEASLAEAKVAVQKAANDAGVELPKIEVPETAKAKDYDKAWQAAANCLRGTGS